jgi:hypothetical protein
MLLEEDLVDEIGLRALETIPSAHVRVVAAMSTSGATYREAAWPVMQSRTVT